jgi:hypothetical protein
VIGIDAPNERGTQGWAMASSQWKPIASAPREGTRILVAIRPSEQGPAEVDVVRWSRAGVPGEEVWIATDSDTVAPVAYADVELSGWMPLPSPLPKLRSDHSSPSDDEQKTAETFETDGSAI